MGIVTVEQHKAGGTLGAPTRQPPKGPCYGGHERQLLWQPDAPPEAASGVQWGWVQDAPGMGVLAESEHLLCWHK